MESAQHFQERAKEIQERLAPHIEGARKNLGDVNTKVVRFIREHPGACLLGALALGVVVGRIASRR